MQRSHRLTVPLITALLLAPAVAAELCEPTPPACEIWDTYWESPTDSRETPDLVQDEWSQYEWMKGNPDKHPIGQSFRPTSTSELYRMDFLMDNRRDARPIRIRLWKWLDGNGNGQADNEEYDATVLQPPLWEDRRFLPGISWLTLVTLYPQITVMGNEDYFIQFEHDPDLPQECRGGPQDGQPCMDSSDCSGEPCEVAPGEFGIAAQVGSDPYADGRFFGGAGRTFIDTRDLWFKTYTSMLGPEPASCDRWSAVGSWTEPDPATADSVTADSFFQVVKNRADLDPRCVQAGAPPRFDSHQCAFYHAFVYDIAGGSGYLNDATEFLYKALFYRVGNQIFASHTYGEHAGWAYKWIEDTLSCEDAYNLKRLLLLNGQIQWPDRTVGVNSATATLALSYKLITDLIPAGQFASLSTGFSGCPPPLRDLPFFTLNLGASDHASWKAYADQVYAEFKAAMDFHVDATHYNAIFWRNILQLIKLYGDDDTIWSDPGFEKFVDRFYQYHEPLGSNAVFGDTRGPNYDWGLSAYLLAKAGHEQKYNDPRYRSLAAHVFDFQLTRNYDVDPWRAAHDGYPSFAHGYIDLEQLYGRYETILPEAPPPTQSEQLDASQNTVDSIDWRGGGRGLGQTFQPTESPLVRLDFRARGLSGSKQATVRLWKWVTDHATTTGADPLFEDEVSLPPGASYGDLSLFPFLDVDTGHTYFVEFRRNQKFDLAGGDNNPYGGGDLVERGTAVANADLWFQAHTLSDDGSALTTRLAVDRMRLSELGDPARYYAFAEPPTQVPNKLTLRSGHDPGDLHAIVNLTSDFLRHGQPETGAVLSLSKDSSLVLTGGTYFDKHLKYDSVPASRKFGQPDPSSPLSNVGQTQVTTTRFTDYRRATVAWFDWRDIDGFDIAHQRRFYFVKNRFLLVRDRIGFNEAMQATSGNIWRARDLFEPEESNWYHLFSRVPLGNNRYSRTSTTCDPGVSCCWISDPSECCGNPKPPWESNPPEPLKNPEQYVLLYMVDRGYTMRAGMAETGNTRPPTPPFVVSQQWTGDAAAQTVQWFDSLLLPHGGELLGLTSETIGNHVDVLLDDGQRVVIKVVVAGENWYFVDNPGTGLFSTPGGEVTTDALYLIARTGGGQPDYLLTQEASTVQIANGAGVQVDRSWGVVTSVELEEN